MSQTAELLNQPPVWKPSEEQIAQSRISQFQRRLGFESLKALQLAAHADPNWFWQQIFQELKIRFREEPHAVYRPSADPTRPEWCVGATVNITESMLDAHCEGPSREHIAIVYESESGETEQLTYGQLLEEVEAACGHLAEQGIQDGDVVALMMPMDVDCIVAFLACVRLGAIILPLFTGYGKAAILARLQEARPKHAIVASQMSRRGKHVSPLSAFREALATHDPSSVVNLWVSHGQSDVAAEFQEEAHVSSTLRWDRAQFRKAHGDKPFPARIVSAESPVLLIFTSGTTGKPKGALHTHCGFPIKAAQDMAQPMNLSSADNLFWLTDLGWMMGPWVIFGSLLNGMTLVLYDGAPDYPGVDRLWQLVERHQITFLGISPVLARQLRSTPASEPSPQQTASLRAIGSTGSPWDRESWLWVFEKILNRSRPIINYSGGTEISGGILCSDMISPLKPCGFSGPILGMDAAIIDDAGKEVTCGAGELVIRNHWIGMTRGFWNNDPRYFTSYWEANPGVWTHGDRCLIDEDGVWYIVGRSDDTLKIAGKRLGPAEVEGILNAHPQVHESAAIGVPDAIKGEALVVYCVLLHSVSVQEVEPLKAELRQLLATELGKPLAPRDVKFTMSLPKTRNAKTIHRIIREVYANQLVSDLSSLENPQAIEDLRNAQ